MTIEKLLGSIDGENEPSFSGSAQNYDNRPIHITRSLTRNGVRGYYFKMVRST